MLTRLFAARRRRARDRNRAYLEAWLAEVDAVRLASVHETIAYHRQVSAWNGYMRPSRVTR